MKWIKKYVDLLEELNIQGTYLTKSKDDKEEFRKRVKELVDSIIQKGDIQLPVEKFGKEFIEIRNVIFKQLPTLKHLDFFKNNYILVNGELDLSMPGTRKNLNPIIQEFLLEMLCGGESNIKGPKKEKVFDLKNIKFEYKLKSNKFKESIYQIVLPENVKQYIIKNKDVNYLDHMIYLSCEPDNFNRIHFKGRIERRQIFGHPRFINDIEILPGYGKEANTPGQLWPSVFDLLWGLPQSIRGLGLGYLMYKQFIQHLGFASSNNGSSKEAQEVWKKLSGDDDLSGLILNVKGNERYETGMILIFDKEFKGDFKRVYQDFIKKIKSEFTIVSIDIDEFLKSKGISEEIAF
jgi:hypothetical protein